MKTAREHSLVIRIKQYGNEKYEILNDDQQQVLNFQSVFSQSQVLNQRKLSYEPDLMHKMDWNKQIDDTKSPQTIQQSNCRLKIRQQLHFSDDEIDESSLAYLACKCSRTGCLKLYCVCFQNNRKCTIHCDCCSCKNNDEHLEDRRLAQDKQLLKFRLSTGAYKENGCKCKKSKCQKNYCECYVRNKKCTTYCKCSNCFNGDKLKKRNK